MEQKNKISSEGDLTLNRRTQILKMLASSGSILNKELCEIFNVSAVTIRNDLKKLENKGLLVRTRGGAIQSKSISTDYKSKDESSSNLKIKQAIGIKASELVKENDTIIINAGSTTLEMAKNLASSKNITIITNSLNIATQFINNTEVTVIMTGGNLDQKTFSLFGPIAEDSVKKIYCDKAFIGVKGIDSKYGISTTNLEDASLYKLIIESSKEVIVLSDSSKFLKRSFSLISPISKIHTLITDSNITSDELARIKNAGIKVIIV